MKIAFIDIYKRLPISSGGDWWTFQLLTDLARNNSVNMFYTSEKSSEEGYLPKEISFDTLSGPTSCGTKHRSAISRQIVCLPRFSDIT
jgi:hypothetical protein